VPNAFGRLERQLEHGPAAERGTDQCGAFHTSEIERVSDSSAIRDDIVFERRLAESWKIDADDQVSLGERAQLRLPHPRIRDARMDEGNRGPRAVHVEPDAHWSSANSGRTNSSNVSRSQLATVTGVSARTEAVRGMSIASATSPK